MDAEHIDGYACACVAGGGGAGLLRHAVLCVQDGWTALKHASLTKNAEVIKMLRSKGAKEEL